MRETEGGEGNIKKSREKANKRWDREKQIRSRESERVRDGWWREEKHWERERTSAYI